VIFIAASAVFFVQKNLEKALFYACNNQFCDYFKRQLKK